MQKWRNVSDLQSLFYLPPLCSYSNPNFNGCRVFGVTIPMQLWHCDPRKAIFFSTSWDKASNSKVWDFEAWEVRYKKMILSSHEWLTSQVSLQKPAWIIEMCIWIWHFQSHAITKKTLQDLIYILVVGGSTHFPKCTSIWIIFPGRGFTTT